ncbi:MAG TPA: YfiR family protein [Methylibium sp.]|nr:YfiR family protein [Methylibium sp.]
MLLALATAWLPLRAANEAAGGDAPRESIEYEVKGAYLFKFGEFVDWPAQAFTGPTSPFIIAVMGSDAMADVLEELAKRRQINGRAVQVKRVERTEFVTPAQIVFIGAGETEPLRTLAESLKSASVLTVTENSKPTTPVGMINFVIRDNRVRFEIDADAADQVGLKISSKVLSLAVTVKSPRQR